MQLLRLHIGGFRDGRDLRLGFARRDDADPALAFLVGPNGAGKSRVLEMLGRIFSHLSAGIPVGLDFELEYELSERRVLITTRPPDHLDEPAEAVRLDRIDAWLLVAEGHFDGWRVEHLVREWPGQARLDRWLPYRVVGLSAGPASRLDWALRQAVLDSLGQRLDPGGDGRPPVGMPTARWESFRESERELLGEERRRLANEPRCIALTGNELLLAILALFSHPRSAGRDDESRDRILGRVDLDPKDGLCAFSLDVAPDWRERVPAAHLERFVELLGQASRRVVREGTAAAPEEDREPGQRAVFEHGANLSAWIGGVADSPLVWFSQLLGWLKLGALENVRLVLQKRDSPGLLLDDDFSDGEFLLAGRYALLLLLRDHPDCLVLFDEPETHFNDQWKIDLISDLVEVLEGNRAQVVIATHSDLTLSDADRSDVYVLAAQPPDEGDEVPSEPPVSPFAADRGEITTKVFGAKQTSGSHAMGIVNRALDSRDRQQLKEALDRAGPGFHRFRLRYALDDEDGDAS